MTARLLARVRAAQGMVQGDEEEGASLLQMEAEVWGLLRTMGNRVGKCAGQSGEKGSDMKV